MRLFAVASAVLLWLDPAYVSSTASSTSTTSPTSSTSSASAASASPSSLFRGTTNAKRSLAAPACGSCKVTHSPAGTSYNVAAGATIKVRMSAHRPHPSTTAQRNTPFVSTANGGERFGVAGEHLLLLHLPSYTVTDTLTSLHP